MNEAWQTHIPADGNVDIDVLTCLDAIVEATRVAVHHVLRISGEAISIQIPWRPAAPFDPDLGRYIALSDFHCRVMTSAHKDSPHARKSPNTAGDTAQRADYTSNAPSNRHPNPVTRVVTQSERKATVPREISTRPKATHTTTTAVAGVTNRDKIKTTPSHSQAAEPAVVHANNPPTIVMRKYEDCLQHGVVVKKSTHVSAGTPKGAWHTDVELTMPTTIAQHTNVERIIQVQSPAAKSGASGSVPDANTPNSSPASTGAASRDLPISLGEHRNANQTETSVNNRREATCVRPDARHLDAQICGPHTPWTSAKFCGPFCQRPCKNHNVELSSSDDEESNGLEQIMPTAKRFGNLNFPPLNPLNQSRWTNSTARPANPAADPAITADRRTTGEATTNRVRPEAAVSVYVTVKTANAYDTPREMVTLEVEDIPVIVPGEGCVCITCYEIIPESQYESHRNRGICHSPARPPEAERDDLSCIATAQRIELNCNTCHRKFKSEHAKDSHEPCEAIRKDAPTKIDARRQPKLFTSTTPADTRRRGAQISTNAAGRIVAYRAAIRKPNTRGTYNVNGKVMSMQDIKRRIQNLSSLLIK